jgi:hypothetical protein
MRKYIFLSFFLSFFINALQGQDISFDEAYEIVLKNDSNIA